MIREEDVWFCVMLGALAPVCAASFLLCKTRGRQCHLTGAVPSGPFTNPKIWECRALSHGNCADQSSGVISEGAMQGAQLRVVSQLFDFVDKWSELWGFVSLLSSLTSCL